MPAASRPRVLVLARNYPNNVIPTLGLWTRRFVEACATTSDPTVIAPVPYAPPLVPIETFARFRRVSPREADRGFDVFHPRVPYPPGYALHRFEAMLVGPAIRRLADRLHEERGFDLIHAHFIYPDGVLAAGLGRRYGIPVVCTEAAQWRPWLDEYPGVREQVFGALAHIRYVLPVSSSLERNIHEVAGELVRTRVVPNVVDDRLFRPATSAEVRDPDQILFVGMIRRVKGLDVLVRSFARLAERMPALHLKVIGGAVYRNYRHDEDEARRLVSRFDLEGRVRFMGQSSPEDVAAAMRASGLLAVPSRRETFSAVTAEALACGIPVVATRCGGPEDIITEQNGVLVASEDTAALADAIERMRGHLDRYEARTLHEDVVARFGTRASAARLAALYADVLA